jgi:hypothetical protein
VSSVTLVRCRFIVRLARAEFRAIVEPVAPYGMSRPYTYCFDALMVSLANSVIEGGHSRVPIDFIFDEQDGLGEEARFLYRIIRDGQPKAVRSILSRDPIFRNDKHVLPLQAADMLAWHVRRNHVRDPEAFQVPEFLSADDIGNMNLTSKVGPIRTPSATPSRSDWARLT